MHEAEPVSLVADGVMGALEPAQHIEHHSDDEGWRQRPAPRRDQLFEVRSLDVVQHQERLVLVRPDVDDGLHVRMAQHLADLQLPDQRPQGEALLPRALTHDLEREQLSKSGRRRSPTNVHGSHSPPDPPARPPRTPELEERFAASSLDGDFVRRRSGGQPLRA